MFRKILRITGRDVRSGLRDNIIVYVILAPFLSALILRGLIPSVGANVLQMAVDPGVEPAVVEYLETIGKVEVLEADGEALERRVRATDDVFGLRRAGERGFEIVKEGNEQEGMDEIFELVLDAYVNQDLDLPMDALVSDIGWKLPPLKQFGASVLVVFMSVFGGMVILINLVEEKQDNTLSAMNVAPVSRTAFVIGKGLLGVVIPVIHAFGVLLILGFEGLNYGMVTVAIFSVALISVLIGFVIGVMNDNVISAASSMKVLFVPILASIMGAIFLADKWHLLLYWSPFYWAFDSMNRIVLLEATWGVILRNTGIVLAITAVVFALLSRRIARGLN